MIFAGTAYRALMLVSYWCHHCSWLARLSRRAVKRAPDTGALVGKIISLSDSFMKPVGEIMCWYYAIIAGLM